MHARVCEPRALSLVQRGTVSLQPVLRGHARCALRHQYPSSTLAVSTHAANTKLYQHTTLLHRVARGLISMTLTRT